MLIAMARGFFVSQFPFKTESGEIVCLTIQKDWLEELGINILKADSTAKYYSFKDKTLYIDEIPVDVPSLSYISLKMVHMDTEYALHLMIKS